MRTSACKVLYVISTASRFSQLSELSLQSAHLCASKMEEAQEHRFPELNNGLVRCGWVWCGVM